MHGYIALGTNLGDRWANLRAGVAGLERAGLPPLALSSVWETEPVDSPDSSWFLNMAVKVEAERHPLELLDVLLEIERRAGRVRTVPNAPRILDLDLLMLGNLAWRDERLELPHPRMWERRFVLEPLSEIAPDLRDPASGLTVADRGRGLADRSRVFKIGRLETC